MSQHVATGRTSGTPLVTGGSNRFRRIGLLETVGERFRSLPLSPPVRRRLRQLFHRALRCQTGGRGFVCRLPGGEEVHVEAEHRYLSWNPEEYAAFRAVVRPGMTALDVGANVGAYTLLFGQWVGEDGRVVAFEPSPGPFNGLRNHVSMNNLQSVVTCVRMAVADRSGTALLQNADASGTSRLVDAPETSGRTAKVRTTTIDEYCAREHLHPDVIKIDVEGAEQVVLQGARETIAAGGHRLQLFVEMHPSLWAPDGAGKAAMLAELAHQGLQAIPLSPVEDPWSVEGICLRLAPVA